MGGGGGSGGFLETKGICFSSEREEEEGVHVEVVGRQWLKITEPEAVLVVAEHYA